MNEFNEYQELLRSVKTDDYYKTDLTNRVNCYVCQSCGRITKTKDIAAGVTPFFHDCEYCGEVAYSSFYEDLIPIKEPTQEWYRPDFEEFRQLDEAMKEHVLKGGLLNRKINKGII